MDESALIILAVGAASAGFIAGLTGLGTALTALAFWLHIMPPQAAVPLACAIAIVNHVVSLSFVRQGFMWRRVWPFLVGGAIGLPIGVLALSALDSDTAKAGLGIFLILYCTYGLVVRQPPTVTGGGRLADGTVGMGGGFLGGLCGIAGPLPTIWAGLRGWPKDQQRAVYQPFNLFVLGVSAVGHLMLGRYQALPVESLIVFPIVAVCAVLGILTYRRLADHHFRKIVLVMLMVGGIVQIVDWLGG